MDKEIIAKSKPQIKNKWFKTKEDELDMALNIIDELEQQCKKQKEVIDRAIEYLETKRIREKAIVDVDVLEGILKEVK